ncbi:MAG: TrmB family transcriptional regulator [Halobacteriales archaeon]
MASLRDLGLTEYEARVYRALLRTGPTTAKQLSSASGVPMGRIYDVLDDLEGLELVRSQNAGRPTQYAPVEVRTALSRLLENRRRELETELEQYEAAVEELAEQLGDPGATGEPFWTVAIGPEDTVDLLCERLATATDRLVMVVGHPSAQFDLGEVGDRVAGELEAALDRGVEVSLLASASLIEAVPEALLRKYGAVAEDPGFELRVTDDLAGTLNLVDRTEVCIEVANPLAPGEALALIALTDPSFAANVHEEFEPRWAAAEPVAALST